jgi:hypothetical protein
MKIPSSEQIVLTYVFEGVECYTVTRNIAGKYILYKITNNDCQKMKTAESPLEFDKIVKKDRGE